LIFQGFEESEVHRNAIFSVNKEQIRKGDVVWAPYRREPLWPALVSFDCLSFVYLLCHFLDVELAACNTLLPIVVLPEMGACGAGSEAPCSTRGVDRVRGPPSLPSLRGRQIGSGLV
uniref:PWWP domain-containing protein n=1 Tax=Angiostrongylus cantonensis TaxID=6313 RepID=A0A0K0CXQ8_ANGCA